MSGAKKHSIGKTIPFDASPAMVLRLSLIRPIIGRFVGDCFRIKEGNGTMINVENHAPHAAISAVHWKSTESASKPDVESAILLRCLVLPAFEHAASWNDLVAALDSIGFGLAIEKGHLTLTEADTGASICTGRFLGKPLVDMAAKLGKPVIRAHPSCDGSGSFCY